MSTQQPAGCLDPLDSLLDLSEYETVSYQSPAISPSTQKSRFSSRSVSNTPSTLPSSTPTLTGPSHNYDLYRQQTGIPQGAIANTLAVNSFNTQINQFGYGDADVAGMGSADDFVDFGTAPGRNGSLNDSDMDFDSPKAEPAFFYPENSADFIDPSSITGTIPMNGLPTQSGNVGRLWPGMHQQQAAVAKAQAQQKQQQQIIQQQRQAAGVRPQQQRVRAPHPPTNPLVEEKISQLLNSMRQSSVTTEGDDSQTSATGMSQTQRAKKEEEEMDEDERLLASEEGKKLSSKERRQLRNKVSARAFRSRRKEYIGQLEGEIAAKVNEVTDLRSQNRALMEENTRLTDLTRMLLSSPSFSGFLDTLAQNPAAMHQPQQQQVPSQQGENRQVRKDVNPYAAQQQMQNQQIGVAMIPEQPMDFSMLDLNADAFSYQPQVFSVFGIPDTAIDSELLSGKSSAPTHVMSSEDGKLELPVVERGPECAVGKVEVKEIETADEEFDSDPRFALFAATATSAPAPAPSKPSDIETVTELLAAIPAKEEQYSLVVESSISDDEAAAASRKVDRICDILERTTNRLRALTLNL